MPKPQTIKLEDLVPEPRNARRRNPRAKTALDRSVEKFGPARSIVVDGDGVVRAGNGTLEAAKKAGVREVVVVDGGPDKLVVVRRADWSEEQAEQYAIADNRTSELADWDYSVLADKLTELEPEGLGFEPAEIDNIVANARWEGAPNDATVREGRSKVQIKTPKRLQVTVLDDELAEHVEKAVRLATGKWPTEVVVEVL